MYEDWTQNDPEIHEKHLIHDTRTVSPATLFIVMCRL